jgi:hypothetical protein
MARDAQTDWSRYSVPEVRRSRSRSRGLRRTERSAGFAVAEALRGELKPRRSGTCYSYSLRTSGSSSENYEERVSTGDWKWLPGRDQPGSEDEEEGASEGMYSLEHWSGGDGIPAAIFVLPSPDAYLDWEPFQGSGEAQWVTGKYVGKVALLLTRHADPGATPNGYLEPMDSSLWAQLAGATLPSIDDGATKVDFPPLPDSMPRVPGHPPPLPPGI